MSIKFGAKLYLSDAGLMDEILPYYDYIELYYQPEMPGMVSAIAENYKEIDFVMHAPHHLNGVNLCLAEKSGMDKVRECIFSAERLHVGKMVVHPGTDGSLDILRKNLKELSDLASERNVRLLLECVPKELDSTGETFPITSPQDYAEMIGSVGCGLCLDFSHASHAAFSNNADYKDYFRQFNELKPELYHLYDTITTQANDVHLNFGDGDLDLDYCLTLVKGQCTLELPPENAVQNYLNAREILKQKGF